MADMTVEELVHAAEKLNPDERAELVVRLNASLPSQLRNRRPALNFPVDELGPWPEQMTLSREELYDDRGR